MVISELHYRKKQWRCNQLQIECRQSSSRAKNAPKWCRFMAVISLEWKSRFAPCAGINRSDQITSWFNGSRALSQRVEYLFLSGSTTNPTIRLADTDFSFAYHLFLFCEYESWSQHLGSLFAADLEWLRSTWRRGRPAASWGCSCWSPPASRRRSRAPRPPKRQLQIRGSSTKTNAPGATSRAAGANEDGKTCR